METVHNDSKKKDKDYVCFYNKNVDCNKTDIMLDMCDMCGWNPQVAEERIAKRSHVK